MGFVSKAWKSARRDAFGRCEKGAREEATVAGGAGVRDLAALASCLYFLPLGRPLRGEVAGQPALAQGCGALRTPGVCLRYALALGAFRMGGRPCSKPRAGGDLLFDDAGASFPVVETESRLRWIRRCHVWL